MKIERLETHDRLLHFKKQKDYISEGCEICIKNRPEEFKNYPFYIFAHQRELAIDERVARFNADIQRASLDPTYKRKYKTLEDVETSRLIWEPRLTKPRSQTNSMLFKAYPPTDKIKVIWMLPAREMWGQYKKENVTADDITGKSIDDFQNNRQILEMKEEDDLSDEQINAIYREMSFNANARRRKQNSSATPEISEEFSTVS